jgi:hypothetical protein
MELAYSKAVNVTFLWFLLFSTAIYSELLLLKMHMFYILEKKMIIKREVEIMDKEKEERKIESRDVVDIGKIQEQLGKLDEIEKQLNEKLYSKEFREELFKSPIDVLRREGIEIPKDKEKTTTEFFKNVTVPDNVGIRVGSDITQKAVHIFIGIRF